MVPQSHNGPTVASGEGPIADPHVERRYLACAFADPEVLARHPVEPADLWAPAHALVLGSLLTLHALGSSIGTDTVRADLVSRGQLARVGDDALIELTSTLPDVNAAADLAASIRRTAALRRASTSALRATEAAQRRDLDATARELDAARLHAEAAAPRSRAWLGDRWRTLSERDDGTAWLREPPPPREWLLQRGAVPMLARGIVGLLVAPGGRGKTYALCDLALSIATGLPWLGVIDVAASGRVVLALAEEDDAEVRRRLYAIARTRGLGENEAAAADARIVALGLAGRDVSLLVVEGSIATPSALHADLVALVSEHEHQAVLLDPLARWAPGVESDNAIATRAIELLEEIATAAGGTVLVAHHSAKWARREGDGAHASSARGVTAITDGARWVAELRGDDDDRLSLVVAKSNGAPLGESIPLVRDRETGLLRGARPEERAATEAARTEERLEALVRQLVDAVAARGATGVRGHRALRELVRGRHSLVRDAIARAIRDGLIVGGRNEPYVVAGPRAQLDLATAAASTRGPS